ncbi:MBL fold metallo-hydrolase [Polynucleobacter sp. MG-28-Ekke-A2]|nr:MBL fold metallo-hydrolase [Polynucleobacter sp. MG-28-Ekke-A2]MEA9601972.1 MBL fold metallo-hydrolase [Polynucleobacter sp. MG-28-Ekke-A2]
MKCFSTKSGLGVLLSAILVSTASLSNAQNSPAVGAQGKAEALWLGQAGFRIKSPQGKMILIDPWITGGPKTPPIYKNDLAAIGPIDVLLVTHAHVDHLGDAPAIAKMNNIKLYGPADMVT